MKRPTWRIEWHEGMCVGIPELDEDHRQFIDMINDLNRSINERREPSEIKRKLKFIVDDAERHFTQEEKLFKEWQYPDTEEHALKHSKALKNLQEIVEKFIPYGHDSEWVDAGWRIKGILVNHILTDDMKYAEFYRKSLETNPNEKPSK